MKGARGGLLLALLAALLYLPGLGRTDLWAPDEPNFAEVSREMLVDGQWILPHDNGEVFTDKPPLLFWLIAFTSAATGVGSWTARLPSALAGIASILLTWRIGLRLLRDERVASAGAAAFAVSWMVFDKARSAQIDMLLCSLILGAILCFLRVRDGGGRGAALGFWALMGLATLAKGPVGLLLPLGIAVVFLTLAGELGQLGRLAPVGGPLLYAGIVGAWMAAAQEAGAAEGYSILDAMNRHVFQRFAEGMHHPKPPWYYLQALPRGILPWSGFLPAMVCAGISSVRRRREPGEQGVLFCFVWFAFVLLFFSVSTEKRDLYVLPLYPAAGLLLAVAVSAACSGKRDETAPTPSLHLPRLWILIPAWATGLLLLVAGAAALALPEERARRLSPALGPLLDEWTGVYGPSRFAVAVLLAGGVATVALLAARRPRGAVAALGAGAAACWLAVGLVVYPAFNPHKSSREFCARIEATAGPTLAPGERVGIYRFYRSTFTFYTPTVRYQTLDSERETLAFLEGRNPRWLLALAEDAASIPHPPDTNLEIVDRGHVGHREYVLMRLVHGPAPASP